jgi:hypothetical protein
MLASDLDCIFYGSGIVLELSEHESEGTRNAQTWVETVSRVVKFVRVGQPACASWFPTNMGQYLRDLILGEWIGPV